MTIESVGRKMLPFYPGSERQNISDANTRPRTPLPALTSAVPRRDPGFSSAGAVRRTRRGRTGPRPTSYNNMNPVSREIESSGPPVRRGIAGRIGIRRGATIPGKTVRPLLEAMPMMHGAWGTAISLLFLLPIAGAPSVAKAMQDKQGKHLFILSGQSNMANLKPEVSFTPAVEAVFGKDNVIVVKDAQGAQPIRRWYKGWKPAQGDEPKATGDLYDRLMGKVKAAIKDQQIASVTFIWMQGERDATEGHGTVYAESLKGLVKQLSGDLKRDDVNVVIGRINDYAMDNKGKPHWTMVREAQVQVARELPRADWVDTDDLNGPKNGIHATEEGYKTLGERFAKKAIALIRSGK